MLHEPLKFATQSGVGTFLVPVGSLAGLRLGQIPPHSTVEITDLPVSPAGYHLGIRSTNCEDASEFRSLGISSTVSISGTRNVERRLARIRRAFKQEIDRGILQEPQELRFEMHGEYISCLGFAQDFANKPETDFAKAIEPVLSAFDKLISPDIHLFICHASEDKPTALQLADYLQRRGTDVWLDQWEIAVGDSIVQKISDALRNATHLAVLLSSQSVAKPWVRRELSSTLMRQLSDNSVAVLPMLLDHCEVPTILADVRFADCRGSLETGFEQIMAALLKCDREDA